jgi:hypothetical protein
MDSYCLYFLQKLFDCPTGLSNDAVKCIALQGTAVIRNGDDMRRIGIVSEVAVFGGTYLTKSLSEQDPDNLRGP